MLLLIEPDIVSLYFIEQLSKLKPSFYFNYV